MPELFPSCRLTSEPLRLCRDVRVGEVVRLGRSSENEIVCDHPSVAPFHARVVWNRGLALPVLRNSTTPDALRVDGARVLDTAPLRHGARIELAQVELRVELLNVGAPETEDRARLLMTFAEPTPLAFEVTKRYKARLAPPVRDYDLVPPGAEDCIAALARVMSPTQATALFDQACAEAGLESSVADLDDLERVVDQIRSRGEGLTRIVAVSLGIRLQSYRCLRAKESST